MKQPRTSDFDPNAAKRAEHKLKSPLDGFPSIERPQDVHIVSTPAIEPSEGQTPPVLVAKRKIKRRHPFDIYQDQFDSLRKLSIKQQSRGGVGSMSEMVREALDMYLNGNQGD